MVSDLYLVHSFQIKKMKNKSKLILKSTFVVAQTNSFAVLRMDPEPELDSDTPPPDWLMYLMLMVVVLIMFGKIK